MGEKIPKSETSHEKEGQNEELVLGKIVASIGESSLEEQAEDTRTESRRNSQNVDFRRAAYASRNEQKGEDGAFVISRIDSENKWSKDYFNCTGVVAVGFDETIGKNISLLSHQNPGKVLQGYHDYDRQSEFEKALRASLVEIAQRSKSGTLDVVIFGGMYTQRDIGRASENREQYLRTIPQLEHIIKESTGLDAEVIIGPNASTNPIDEVFLDTERRRLRVVLPEQPLESQANTSFPAATFSREAEKWRGT